MVDANLVLNVQKAVISQLRHTAALNAYLGGSQASDAARAGMRLYDAVPEKPNYPLAALDSIEARPADQDARGGHQVRLMVALADRPADRGEAVSRSDLSKAMMIVVDALHRNEAVLSTRLSTDGSWSLVQSRYETARVMFDPDDNMTVIATVDFSFLIDEVI